MIKVNYLGRLGNNMFQYALGRYLAEEMGYELAVDPLPFPATKKKVLGYSYQHPQQTIGPLHIDIAGVLGDETPRSILLHGFFQYYRYYEPFLDRVRRWFKYPEDLASPIAKSNEDLLIYIRLGDYSDVGMNLKFGFYETAIQMSQAKKITIVTEDTNHPFLKEFDAYQPVIISQDPLSDLAIARSFKKIAISCSTFSWWAALLAEPEEVYVPLADGGHWSPQSIEFPNFYHDLRIDDSRYIYFYNSAIMASNRTCLGFEPISKIKSVETNLQQFLQNAINLHKNSKAYWFI